MVILLLIFISVWLLENVNYTFGLHSCSIGPLWCSWKGVGLSSEKVDISEF